MVSLPLEFSMATGQKILPFGFRMPYFDQTTWFGYNSNYALHFVLSLYVLSEGMGPDSMFMVLMMSSFTQIDLLKTSLQELSEKINKKELNIGNSLKHIINRHQEHLRYLQTIEAVHRIFYLVSFVSFGAHLVLSLYAVVKLSWYQGLAFMFFISYELLFSCFMGTLLAIKSEQLQRAIYDVPWHKMSSVNQKKIRFLLEASQKPLSLTLIFYRIDMPTFLKMYKTIYSIFTMLLTVREDYDEQLS
ncbi:odorant receptor 10a [Culex quinquefasciatus]|uniref:odorant receptor 10a n=1 Tax=Culex quinquefasciatus TaxID=7176 RepID=UPI0018E3EC49|nr:odorant receptor 10a [Culex quinquefasciatus]